MKIKIMQKSKNSDLKQFENFSSAINFFFFSIFSKKLKIYFLFEIAEYISKLLEKMISDFFRLTLFLLISTVWGGFLLKKPLC